MRKVYKCLYVNELIVKYIQIVGKAQNSTFLNGLSKTPSFFLENCCLNLNLMFDRTSDLNGNGELEGKRQMENFVIMLSHLEE